MAIVITKHLGIPSKQLTCTLNIGHVSHLFGIQLCFHLMETLAFWPRARAYRMSGNRKRVRALMPHNKNHLMVKASLNNRQSNFYLKSQITVRIVKLPCQVAHHLARRLRGNSLCPCVAFSLHKVSEMK